MEFEWAIIGEDVFLTVDALKAAVMCEDAARTVHLACELGDPIQLESKDIDALYDRYQNVYGQR